MHVFIDKVTDIRQATAVKLKVREIDIRYNTHKIDICFSASRISSGQVHALNIW